MIPRIKGKKFGVFVAFLFFALGVINRSRVYSRWRPGFQSIGFKTQINQVLGQSNRTAFSRSSGVDCFPPYPNLTVHKRPSRQHHRFRVKLHSKVRLHPNALVVRIHQQLRYHSFPNKHFLVALNFFSHGVAVFPLIRLRSQRPHRRTSTGIQNSLLYVRFICNLTHAST